MCGICGIVSIQQHRPVDAGVLQRMTRCMHHRGPDEEGTYCRPMVGLGSRRLSIIDLAGGQQPIANEDETLWIVFNGEIYNFQELRVYLERQGHQFRTHTDTEVILHLYEEFGPDCVQHLNGIFAFAIWHEPAETLFIARDRMGIKPLYYTITNNQLIFGSELKVILAHPDVQREVDLISLNEYLSFEYVPSPRTILRNIFRLEAGHWLLYNRAGLRREAYWQLSLARSELRPPVHWRDYAPKLLDRLQQTVQQELVSDVPVGVLLSGGLDSSTIAALMVQSYPGRVKSFSIGFEENSFDESGYARQVAQHLGTEHHELVLTSKLAAEMVPTITDFLDEPFADSSLIPTLLLSQFARQQVKVVLGGDGGDELFAGYPTLTAHRLIEYYERIVPRTVRASVAPRLLKRLPVSFNNISFDFKVRRLLSGRGVPLQARHHRWLGAFMDEQKEPLLQPWITPILRNTYTPAYEHARACDARLPLNQILYSDMKLYLEGDILYKVDRASMAASLEVRVPFLNRSLISFASELPLELKLHRFTTKFLLKKSVRHLLPREIIERPKKGFNMPVAKWLTGELRELTLDMLSPGRVAQQGYFQANFVSQLLDEHFARRQDHRKLLWTLLIFQLWHARYMEP